MAFLGVLRQLSSSCFILHTLSWVDAPLPSCFLSFLSDSRLASYRLSSFPSVSPSEPDRDFRLVPCFAFPPFSQGFLSLLLFLFPFSSLLLLLFFPELCLSSVLLLPSPGIFPSVGSLSPPFLCSSLLPWLRPWVRVYCWGYVSVPCWIFFDSTHLLAGFSQFPELLA